MRARAARPATCRAETVCHALEGEEGRRRRSRPSARTTESQTRTHVRSPPILQLQQPLTRRPQHTVVHTHPPRRLYPLHHAVRLVVRARPRSPRSLLRAVALALGYPPRPLRSQPPPSKGHTHPKRPPKQVVSHQQQDSKPCLTHAAHHVAAQTGRPGVRPGLA